MPSASKEQTLGSQHLDTLGKHAAVQPTGRARLVASIDEAACTACGACQAVCPTGAITLGEVAFEVNGNACCGCGACMEVCPRGAIGLN